MQSMKITIEAKTMLGEDVIASHVAVLEGDDLEASFYFRQIDKDACKENRELIRKETAEFEDKAYDIQDYMRSKK